MTCVWASSRATFSVLFEPSHTELPARLTLAGLTERAGERGGRKILAEPSCILCT